MREGGGAFAHNASLDPPVAAGIITDDGQTADGVRMLGVRGRRTVVLHG